MKAGGGIPSHASCATIHPKYSLDATWQVSIVVHIVKAQVRDLHYNSSNLYPNCLIRHILTKWIDHRLSICRWGVRMALKGLGIRKCVCSELASCIFNSRCISITYCCSSFICYNWISFGIWSCISA